MGIYSGGNGGNSTRLFQLPKLLRCRPGLAGLVSAPPRKNWFSAPCDKGILWQFQLWVGWVLGISPENLFCDPGNEYSATASPFPSH
jgi:hypothetical protein